MQRGTSNSYLPTENYVSGGNLGQSNLIPIIVTPSQGTHAPYMQGSEQRISQPINLSLPARVSMNHENGADRASEALTSSSSRSVGSIIGQNASYTVVSDGHGQDLGSTSESLDLRESMSATNTMLPNEATSGFGPIRTMAYAAHSYRIIYRRPEPHLVVMLPNVSGNIYFSYRSPAIILANGTNTYHVSIIPRNPFSYWIPAGMLTNTLAPVLPVMHAPSFSVPLPHFSWNWIISHQHSLSFVPIYQFPHISLVPGAERIITREMVSTNFAFQQASFPINHTPRFEGVNHGHGLTLLNPYNFHMAQNAIPQTFFVDVENMSYEGLLAFQDQVGYVNTGLSREVISARMKCIKYQSTASSTSDNDMCCICLDDFSDGQIIGRADCQHTFHFDCISQWLMQKNSCPLCKRTALAI